MSGTSRRRPALVRAHVVTCGRAAPSRNIFDLATLVLLSPAAAQGATGLGPEGRRVVELCGPGALSVAEIAAHLHLPLPVLRVVLADLVDTGHITTHAPIPVAELPDVTILEEVLRGLRAL
ncbi:DUF742 domain-containing protein [Streptomyces sp. G-5]|uniref:DUF742 domain-containing protein n=1 Tax=Streptomyces sp. G-5 TaxID=2977231 RepID=UPI0021CF428C|nr:DUF742 domain-containing protein [Streptomyces sp. G-5]MCU4750249.1 DUF742 domain-containing protein [Streptomyces sp. G-5]